ncbi:hypothetical protein MKW94_030312 [Papaver nudicaule]|uniref:Pentatricopeptide repeat-containing protein n=1 Tax=Papaver nudicaule TaxID=74823 RepID=A0AA42AXP6_PAPNU|nr:hypothetical protein [Papaver nudicaule]
MALLNLQCIIHKLLNSKLETKNIKHVTQIHSQIITNNLTHLSFLFNHLINLYSKCGQLDQTLLLFSNTDHSKNKNVITWTSLITQFSRTHNKSTEALNLFNQMRQTGAVPNEFTYSALLPACCTAENMSVGKQIHCLVLKHGVCANNGSFCFGRQVHGVGVKHGLVELGYVKNSLIDMYSKCGGFGEAVKLFRTIADKDVVTWNVMVMGLVQNNRFEEACNCFRVMRSEGVSPDEASISTALHASASLGALDQGALIHSQIIKSGFVSNSCVASSLVTVYAKCGGLEDASRVFEEIEDRSVVCWTAMIAACQLHGSGDQVIELFEEMLAKGIKPDHITLVCVLSACGHTGRLEKGLKYYDSMISLYGIKPGSEHYACVVDMLSRAGLLDEAKMFIESMPLEPDPSVWGALLGGCRKHGNLEIGKEVAERLFKMEPRNSGNYVLLSNIYARYGMLEKADEVRKAMGLNGVKKEPGCSC